MKKAILFGLMLSISILFIGQTNTDLLIVSSFSQGSANNCASIALIKAAMLKFGYKNMFGILRNGSNYNIILKDGTQFIISEMERKEAIKAANFKIPDLPSLGSEKDSVLFYAYLAYASIAKFIAAKGYWGCEGQGSLHLTNHNTYADALDFISVTGVCTDYCNRLLGYKTQGDTIYDFKKPSDANQLGTILYCDPHAVATFGDQLNCYDSWVPITKKKVCGNKFKYYIVLE